MKSNKLLTNQMIQKPKKINQIQLDLSNNFKTLLMF